MEAIVAAVAKAKAEVGKAITTDDLARTLAVQHQTTKVEARRLLDEIVDLIAEHLKKGERVKIKGLGILQVRDRAARIRRNPSTGETIQIKASKKVAFRTAKQLKMAI